MQRKRGIGSGQDAGFGLTISMYCDKEARTHLKMVAQCKTHPAECILNKAA